MAKRFDSQEFDNSVNNNSRFVSFHSHFLRQMENQVEPLGNHIRYEIRQKRADAKRALKDLLFNSGSSKITFQDHFPKLDGTTSWNTEHADHSDISGKRSRSNTSTRHSSKAQHKRMKRKARQESFSDDFDGHHETVFQATFGNRWYTWSFKSWEESNFHTSTNGFEWRGHPNWNNSRNREWQNASDIESDDESCIIGSSSERAILGLPSRGPLKIEDVKNASFIVQQYNFDRTPCSFRLSALKWHPDKHQGSSQGNGRREIQTLCRCIQITMQCTFLSLNYLVQGHLFHIFPTFFARIRKKHANNTNMCNVRSCTKDEVCSRMANPQVTDGTRTSPLFPIKIDGKAPYQVKAITKLFIYVCTPLFQDGAAVPLANLTTPLKINTNIVM
ncbi:unnamed protein product [Camellia sinensis]